MAGAGWPCFLSSQQCVVVQVDQVTDGEFRDFYLYWMEKGLQLQCDAIAAGKNPPGVRRPHPTPPTARRSPSLSFCCTPLHLE